MSRRVLPPHQDMTCECNLQYLPHYYSDDFILHFHSKQTLFPLEADSGSTRSRTCFHSKQIARIFDADYDTSLDTAWQQVPPGTEKQE